MPEGLDRLATLTAIEVRAGVVPEARLRRDAAPYSRIPAPREDVRRLFEAANVSIPTVLPTTTANVSTKQKLPKHRKQK